LCFGAHPDDCDFSTGGLAALYARAGHQVRMISLANGDAGHYAIGGIELARRRYYETQAAAVVIGVEYHVWDIHDGELEPTLEMRRRVISEMRSFQADLVLAHRADDYHPDHRAVGVLVQDASYLVGVPNIVPLTPITAPAPVICHYAGYASAVDEALIAVDIDPVYELKMRMLDCHASQVYEWLPYDQGILDQVPAGAEERFAWLQVWREARTEAAPWREALVRRYGAERGAQVRYAEAFIPCAYGPRMTPELQRKLFPF